MTEALSPSSAALKPLRTERSCRLPTKRAAVADVHAPSVSLPLGFILTGITALLVGASWLTARPINLAGYHYGPEVVAATHLFVLGWICSVIMGTMYQLVPVALETRLHSERLARWHFGLHLVGFVGMVMMFLVWDMKQVGHFGSVLATGVGLFVYNLARTLARIPRWNVVAIGIASSLAWLSLTILAGLYLSAAKCWTFSPFEPMAQMHAHAHLGGLGFFVMMIVSVSFKLVPMFTLSEVQNHRRAGGSLVLLNAGLAGLFVTILLSSPWKLFFASVIATGLAFYGWEVIAILHARKRRNRDWGMRYFLTALALLIPVSGLGLVLAWPRLPATELTAQLESVYGLLAFIGVVTLAILGMLYKVVPFLVWYASYSKAIGRSKVPALADLYSPVLQAVGYWLFLVGLALTSVAAALGHATCVRAGCALLLASVTVFIVNMGAILSHLVRPRLMPLDFKSAQATCTQPPS
jgi:hypothetical protein